MRRRPTRGRRSAKRSGMWIWVSLDFAASQDRLLAWGQGHVGNPDCVYFVFASSPMSDCMAMMTRRAISFLICVWPLCRADTCASASLGEAASCRLSVVAASAGADCSMSFRRRAQAWVATKCLALPRFSARLRRRERRRRPVQDRCLACSQPCGDVVGCRLAASGIARQTPHDGASARGHAHSRPRVSSSLGESCS